MSAKPWGAAHAREAHACLLEAAAAAARRGAYLDAENVARQALRDASNEARFLDALGYVDVRGSDAKRVLRKVRGLAEGALVRETWFRVGLVWYRDETQAKNEADELDLPRFRVTRIRRA